MIENDIWPDSDEDCLIYYHYWLCDSGAGNVNRLRWLYDEE
jgi:hypothetical protein